MREVIVDDAAGAAGPVARPTTTTEPLAALDALRGLAALAVVVFHLGPLVENEGSRIPLAALGEVGVNVFFVLSGFLIATSVLAPATFDVRSYLVRRAGRILPMYYASLALVLLFVDATPLVTADGWVDIGLHLTLLHGLSRDHMVTINGVMWSLSAEWLFYLVMAVLAPLFRRRLGGWAIALGAVAAGVAWRAGAVTFASFEDLGFLARTFPAWLDVFGLGMLAALVVRTPRWAAWRSAATLRVGLLVAALGAGVVTLLIYRDRLPAPPSFTYFRSDVVVVLWPTCFAVAVTLAITALVAGERWYAPLARRSGLAHLGLISYSVYLLHTLLIQSLGRAWRATGGEGPTAVLVAAVLVATLAVSAATYRWVEVPAMRWARARARGTRTTTAS